MKAKSKSKIYEIIKEERAIVKESGRFYNTVKIDFKSDCMFITVDGNRYKINLRGYSDKLYKASGEDRMKYKISPDGYGISWEKLDEDLSVKSLIRDGIKLSNISKTSATNY